MGTTEQGNENIRKLQTTGEDGQSYMITLPKELIEEVKWRKGQKLTVTLWRRLITDDCQA